MHKNAHAHTRTHTNHKHARAQEHTHTELHTHKNMHVQEHTHKNPHKNTHAHAQEQETLAQEHNKNTGHSGRCGRFGSPCPLGDGVAGVCLCLSTLRGARGPWVMSVHQLSLSKPKNTWVKEEPSSSAKSGSPLAPGPPEPPEDPEGSATHRALGAQPGEHLAPGPGPGLTGSRHRLGNRPSSVRQRQEPGAQKATVAGESLEAQEGVVGKECVSAPQSRRSQSTGVHPPLPRAPAQAGTRGCCVPPQ